MIRVIGGGMSKDEAILIRADGKLRRRKSQVTKDCKEEPGKIERIL